MIEVILNGLMAGVMYALVALGFVLIYKASGIFNYAQGVMALFAALTLVGLQSGQVPFSYLINAIFGTELSGFGWTLPAAVAIILTLAVMVLMAILVERYLLKHLVNQEPIILFMATIGLAYFLEGIGDLMWGSEIKTIDIGLVQGGNQWIERSTEGWAEGFYGFYLDNLAITAAIVAIVLVTALTLMFQYTKTGRALRAVADDHQAALSVGISLRLIWVIVWSIAGAVALVAGAMWGAKSGVSFSLSLIALKALPVLMLGGFTTISVARPMDLITSLIDPSMNTPSSDVISRSTPSGICGRSSSTAARTSLDMVRVLPTDWRVISTLIATCPLTRAVELRACVVYCTKATSATRVVALIGIWPTMSTVTSALPTLSAIVCELVSNVPSGVSTRSAESALATSVIVSPRLSSEGISSVTRNS